MKYLIINADDFGLSSDVNEGIIRAWKAGAITNATIMIKGEAAGEAIAFARENPDFSVGLHLDLDEIICGDAKGAERFSAARLKKKLGEPGILEKLEDEIEGQVGLFRETGLPLTHIDGHHHLHALPEIFPLIVEIMKRHGIKTVRLSNSYDLVKYPPIEWEDKFHTDMMNLLKSNGLKFPDYFVSTLSPEGLGSLHDGVTELMVHPGRGEEWREKDLEVITSDKWLDEIKAEDIELISFRNLLKHCR